MRHLKIPEKWTEFCLHYSIKRRLFNKPYKIVTITTVVICSCINWGRGGLGFKGIECLVLRQRLFAENKP